MAYSLTGEFLESCDCTVICPCWVDDDPIGGHCTGFILWRIDVGTIDHIDPSDKSKRVVELDVADCKVVSVSTHSGNRRQGGATTSVLYVDPGRQEPADQVVVALGKAFAGETAGTLKELSEVSGTVVGVYRARITSPGPTKDRRSRSWRVRVEECQEENGEILRIEAAGRPRIFDKEDVLDNNKMAQPMSLKHTALSHELQAQGSIEAQQGEQLTVRVGALPGGNLEVQGRSGMRGKFKYKCDEELSKRASSTSAAS